MKEQWQKKVIISESKRFLGGIRKRTIIVIAIVLSIIIFSYFRQESFVYTEFDAIELPPLLRALPLVSLITFCTTATLLYSTKFYLYLRKVCDLLFNFRTYKEIKAIVWILLVSFTWKCIQVIVNFINKCIEITYNISVFFFFIN